MSLSFACSTQDQDLVRLITRRYEALLERYPDIVPVKKFESLVFTMDLVNAHCNGSPLRLRAWLDAPAVEFMRECHLLEQRINRVDGGLFPGVSLKFAVSH